MSFDISTGNPPPGGTATTDHVTVIRPGAAAPYNDSLANILGLGTGAVGPQGPKGDTGATGPAGPAGASGGGASSVLVVYLSQHGITSDATNGVDYGAVAPSGAAGQEAAINALLASSVSAAASAGVAGVRVVWDVAVALGGPIYLYSNMTVEAPNAQCGAILRANAQCQMFRLHGTESAPSSNTSTASQNSFGKLDPAHSGDYRYRVFDPAYVNARNVAIIGGTWNWNSPQQPGPTGTQGAGNNQWTSAAGMLAVFALWGVDGLIMRDMRVFLCLAFHIHLINWNNVSLTNIDVDGVIFDQQGNDCVHFNGPGRRAVITNILTHCADDNIAINADDAGSLTSNSGTITPGINWCCSGPISDVIIDDMKMWSGRSGVLGYGCVRVLTTAARIDGVVVRNLSGLTTRWACLVETFGTALAPGSGSVGRLAFDGCTFDLASGTGTHGVAAIQVGVPVDYLEIRDRYRYSPQTYPDVAVLSGGSIQCLRVAGTYRALSLVTAPVVKLSGGSVSLLVTDVGTDNVANLLDCQSGTVATAVLQGVHRFSGGGSPVNLASGFTLTNLIYRNLVYNTGNAITSGAGTLTNNNTYSETGGAAPSMVFTTAPTYGTGKFGQAEMNGVGAVTIPAIAANPSPADTASGKAYGACVVGFWYKSGGNTLTASYDFLRVVTYPGNSGINGYDGSPGLYFAGNSFGIELKNVNNGAGSATINVHDGAWHFIEFVIWGDNNQIYAALYIDTVLGFSANGASSNNPTFLQGTNIPLTLDGTQLGAGDMIDDLVVRDGKTPTATLPTAAYTRTAATKVYLPFDENGTGS